MFQWYLLNSHVQHITTCLHTCSVTCAQVKMHKNSWPEIWKSQKVENKSYSLRYIKPTRMYEHQNRHPYLYLFTCAFYNAPSTTSSLFPILKHCTIQENYSRKQLRFQLTLNSMTLVFWEFIKSSRKQTALHLSKDSDGQHSTRGCVHMETDTNCE